MKQWKHKHFMFRFECNVFPSRCLQKKDIHYLLHINSFWITFIVHSSVETARFVSPNRGSRSWSIPAEDKGRLTEEAAQLCGSRLQSSKFPSKFNLRFKNTRSNVNRVMLPNALARTAPPHPK